MSGDELDRVEEAIDYRFGDREWLVRALTHRSFTHERGGADSERLEFLGDAVLSAATSTLLVRRFPQADQGELSRLRSRLVNTGTLARIGRQAGLGDALRLGRGEDLSGGREKSRVLEDATEAVLGAVYRDGGFEAAFAVVRRWMQVEVDHLEASDAKDPRSTLQELTQRTTRAAPTYAVVSMEGPAHAPTFTGAVYMGDRRLGTGTGSSKRVAFRRAAQDALARLEATEDHEE